MQLCSYSAAAGPQHLLPSGRGLVPQDDVGGVGHPPHEGLPEALRVDGAEAAVVHPHPHLPQRAQHEHAVLMQQVCTAITCRVTRTDLARCWLPLPSSVRACTHTGKVVSHRHSMPDVGCDILFISHHGFFDTLSP